MNNPKVITAEWLEGLGACGDQVELFEKEWPNGVEVTKENVIRALALGLNIGWLVDGMASFLAYERWRVRSHMVHDSVRADVFMEIWRGDR